ncbi:unnamed protein product, partial [marine sediment metagenome]
FAVGTGCTITHYDGNSDNVWSEMDVGTLSENLYGVWGTSSLDVYAVGDKGTLLHYDGNAWSQVESSTGNSLEGIWGSQPFDIYAVGSKGAIVHYLEQGPPTIASVAPNQGIQGTTLIATITGTNFALASEVGFGPRITVNSFVVNYSRDEVTANITIDWDADTCPGKYPLQPRGAQPMSQTSSAYSLHHHPLPRSAPTRPSRAQQWT